MPRRRPPPKPANDTDKRKPKTNATGRRAPSSSDAPQTQTRVPESTHVGDPLWGWARHQNPTGLGPSNTVAQRRRAPPVRHSATATSSTGEAQALQRTQDGPSQGDVQGQNTGKRTSSSVIGRLTIALARHYTGAPDSRPLSSPVDPGDASRAVVPRRTQAGSSDLAAAAQPNEQTKTQDPSSSPNAGV